MNNLNIYFIYFIFLFFINIWTTYTSVPTGCNYVGVLSSNVRVILIYNDCNKK